MRPRAFKFLAVRCLDPWFKKSPQNVLFVVKARTIFSANHRVVCEHLIRESMQCNLAVFAPGRMPTEIADELTKHNIQLFQSYSMSYLKFLFSAGVVFISHSVRDSFISRPNRNRKVVNYWHGATYKKIENRMGNLEISKEKLIERNAMIYSYLVASCKGDQKLMSESFGVPMEQVVSTGLPRYDLLRNYDRVFNFSKRTDELFGDLKSRYKKVILFAPTFRELAISPLSKVLKSDYEELNSYLAAENYYLVVRPHYYDKFTISDQYSNISMLSHWDHPESNIVLSHIDLLIVDYSSIWIDFLVMNKPIIFFQQDYEYYRDSERGLNYEQSFLPGEVVSHLVDLKDVVNASFVDDEYELKRQEVSDYFHDYDQGLTCSKGLELALDDIFQAFKK